MKEEEQQIAIAKVCGWENIGWQPRNSFNESTDRALGNNRDWWRLSSENTVCMESELPDYLNDLNAICAATVNLIPAEDRDLFYGKLATIVADNGGMDRDLGFWVDHATAAQRSEAFLKTLNLWIE